MTTYDERHGSAYDRGGADAYYRRKFEPHYYRGDTYNSERIELFDPESDVYKAYAKGYQDTVDAGDFKDWG
jgi:hypothetical protein